MHDEENLEKQYNKDLRDMVETYRAFKRLGILGTSAFGVLAAIAGLVYTILRIAKTLK